MGPTMKKLDNFTFAKTINEELQDDFISSFETNQILTELEIEQNKVYFCSEKTHNLIDKTVQSYDIIDKENNLINTFNKKTDAINENSNHAESKIVEHYDENKTEKSNYTKLFENYIELLNKKIDDLQKINNIYNAFEIDALKEKTYKYKKISSLLISNDNRHLYDIKKDNLITKQKIEKEINTEYYPEEKKTNFFEDLSKNERIYCISQICSDYSFLTPSNVLDYLERNPENTEDIIKSDIIEKAKTEGNNIQPTDLLYKFIDKGYGNRIEHLPYIISKVYSNGDEEIEYASSKDKALKYIDQERKTTSAEFINLYQNDKDKKLLLESTRKHIRDYENNTFEGYVDNKEFSRIYNKEIIGNEKITDDTSQVLLDYLKKENYSLYKEKNNDNLSLINNRNNSKTNEDIGNILFSINFIAKDEQKRITESNKNNRNIIFTNEGTQKASEIRDITAKLLGNLGREGNKDYKDSEKEYLKAKQQRDFLSVNYKRFTKNYENLLDNTADNIKKQSTQMIERLLKSGLTKEQIDKVFKETYKAIEKMEKINTITRGRKK